jgi:hypothetical protein
VLPSSATTASAPTPNAVSTHYFKSQQLEPVVAADGEVMIERRG